MRTYKVREAIRVLKNDGWYLIRQVGSHKQFRHLTKKGKVTVADHPGDLSTKDLKQIEKQAGIKFE